MVAPWYFLLVTATEVLANPKVMVAPPSSTEAIEKRMRNLIVVMPVGALARRGTLPTDIVWIAIVRRPRKVEI